MTKQQKPKEPHKSKKDGTATGKVVAQPARFRRVSAIVTPTRKNGVPDAGATREILLAGSGGQGVILAGKMLAQAAVAEGWNATYIPAYGAEVRGGTAHCHVKIGRRQIGSPIVEDATIVVAMNEPSYRVFCPLLRKGSTLVVNSSLVPEVERHPGVKIISLELTKIAADMGSLRSANLLAFGLCVGLLGLENSVRLKGLLGENLGKKNPSLLAVNERILERGVELGREASTGLVVKTSHDHNTDKACEEGKRNPLPGSTGEPKS
jgi:2-oxoglutarate ferredoxin oxidoreductase subunit gamma